MKNLPQQNKGYTTRFKQWRKENPAKYTESMIVRFKSKIGIQYTSVPAYEIN